MRRSELWVLGGFTAGVIGVAVIARSCAPEGNPLDFRRSTFLVGPHNARGLKDALEAVGVKVVQLTVPLFPVLTDSQAARRGDLVLVLSPQRGMTRPEARDLAGFVRRGGTVALVQTVTLRRFGLQVVPLVHRGRIDSMAVRSPPGIEHLPATRLVLVPLARDSDRARTADGVALAPVRAETLLVTHDGRPVAERLTFGSAGSGSVLAVADARYFSNKSFKTTDAGTMVVSWLLDTHARRVVVDEYHQGFGRQWAIVDDAWNWMIATPGGAALLQLAAVALVALVVTALRFGPIVPAVRRLRRSPLEHVEALGAGLERAGGSDAAVVLIVRGLRRRLAGGRQTGIEGRDLDAWLDGLARAADRPAVRQGATRLGWLARERGRERTLAAAQTVEDVWEALRRRSPVTSGPHSSGSFSDSKAPSTTVSSR